MNTFEQMIEHQHERVCFHQDPDTGLRAIIAVHSTTLGNALGGTRRWHYATEADALYDALRLSEAMTHKAVVSDLPMGGAKSVILLPKPGHAASEAEARAMGRFVETFNGAYIAAEDVGVNPQYVDWMRSETNHAMGGQRGGDPSPFTARGVLIAMRTALSHLGRPTDLGGLTVAVQGIGHVGRCLVGLLRSEGARIIVSDINEDRVTAVVNEFGAIACAPDKILSTECDILAPCGLGGVISAKIANRLHCPIIAGAANNVLDDPDEDAVALRNQGILYAPDVIANAGGLIHLAGLYLGLSEQDIDHKIDNIETTMAAVLQEAESLPSTYAAMIAYVERRIAGGSPADKERVHAG